MTRFTYRTDEQIIKRLKIFAIENGTNANEILDMAFRMFELVNDVDNFNKTVGELLISTEDFSRLYINRKLNGND